MTTRYSYDAELAPAAEEELAAARAELEEFEADERAHNFIGADGTVVCGTKSKLRDVRAEEVQRLARYEANRNQPASVRLLKIAEEAHAITEHDIRECAAEEGTSVSRCSLGQRALDLQDEAERLRDERWLRAGKSCPLVERSKRKLESIDQALRMSSDRVERARRSLEEARRVDALLRPLREEIGAMFRRAEEAAATLVDARAEVMTAEDAFGREPSDTAWKRVEVARRAVERATVIERVARADAERAKESFADRAAAIVDAPPTAA